MVPKTVLAKIPNAPIAAMGFDSASAKGAKARAINPPTLVPISDRVADSFSNDSAEVLADVSISLNFSVPCFATS